MAHYRLQKLASARELRFNLNQRMKPSAGLISVEDFNLSFSTYRRSRYVDCRLRSWLPSFGKLTGVWLAQSHPEEDVVQQLFQNLLGGGQKQQELQDFVQRYQQGHPAEGYSDQEVVNRYQQVAPQLPMDVYQQSAEQSFSRLSPQERQEFAEWLQQRTQQQHIQAPQFQQSGAPQQFAQDPRALAEATAQLQQQQPGFLGQLLGGLTGGMGSSQPTPAGQQREGGIPEMNTAQKAALAGIAAMAVKMVVDSRRAG